MTSTSRADRAWTIETGSGPVVCTAIHAGHSVREGLEDLFALSSEERLREEDPFTDLFLPRSTAYTRIVVHRSRFECDLNRPRSKAVYREPADAWGLDVWRKPIHDAVFDASYELHDRFYHDVDVLIGSLLKVHNRIVVLDVHSYNHRRGGPDATPAPVETDPDYNIGTATMTDPERWADIIGVASSTLAGSDRCGAPPVVKENVRFRGGYLADHLHTRYPGNVCVLSLEVKKFFMDEWTGTPDGNCLNTVATVIHRLADTINTTISPRQQGFRP